MERFSFYLKLHLDIVLGTLIIRMMMIMMKSVLCAEGKVLIKYYQISEE